jgi:parallel beta-helix repeat protein
VDVCNVNMQDGYIGWNNGTCWNSESGLVLRSSQMSGFYAMATAGGSTGEIIDGNYYVNNGIGGSLLHHSHYAGSCDAGSFTNIKFTNNEIHTGSYCNGVIVVLHQDSDGLTVENNLVTNSGGSDYCSAIWASGSASYRAMGHLYFHRNRVAMNAAGGTEAIHVSSCSDCVVSDNLVVTNGYNGIMIGTEDVGGTSAYTTGTIAQNNTLYMTGPGALGFRFGVSAQGNAFVIENNAVWSTNSGTCIQNQSGVGFIRNGNNYCRLGSGDALSSVFVDAPGGNFRPLNPGPLIGTANQTYYSPTAIGTTAWSADDAGQTRTPPIDIGAFQR